MAYIGISPVVGEFKKLDDISSQFNDSNTTFNLTVSGSSVIAGSAQNLIISIDGVVQEPQASYTVGGSTITFTEAPNTASAFFGILLGSVAQVGTVSDGAITTSKIADDSITTAKISANAITTAKIEDNAITTAKISGVLPIAKGGTGVADAGASGNILVSNGSVFVSQANPPSSLTNNTRQAVTSNTTTTINLNSGHVVDLTMAANVTSLSFTNVPASGTPVEVKLIVKNDSSGTYYPITWPTSIYWDGDTSIDSVAGGPTLAIGKNGVTVVSLLTTDGGTKWRGSVQASISGGNAYEVYAWGNNRNHTAGLETSSNKIFEPTSFIGNDRWTKVASNNYTGLGLKSDGTMWVWGQNRYGSIGVGTYSQYNDRPFIPGGSNAVPLTNRFLKSPIQLGTSSWSDIGTFFDTMFAIKSDGTLWGWGNSGFGEVGRNNTAPVSSPTQIGALTNWSKLAISQGSNRSVLAVKSDGTLWAWGRNNHGQHGTNNLTDKSSPTQVGALTNWAEVAITYAHCLALKTDGTIWAWGLNDHGNLGLNDRVNRSSPVQVGILTTWSKVNTGVNASAAITTANTLFMWGYNSNTTGRLGQNDIVRRSSPVQVGALTDWKQVSVGTGVFAVKTDGTLWGWGYNNLSTLFPSKYINSPGVSFSSPVQIGTRTDWDSVKSSAAGMIHAIANRGDVNPA